jgi:hypothetical protein
LSLKVRVWTSKILKYDDAIIMINFVRLSSATKKTGHRIKRVRERHYEPKFLRRFRIIALKTTSETAVAFMPAIKNKQKLND